MFVFIIKLWLQKKYNIICESSNGLANLGLVHEATATGTVFRFSFGNVNAIKI